MISAASAAGSPVRSSKRCSFTSFLEPPRETLSGPGWPVKSAKATGLSLAYSHVQRTDRGLLRKNHRAPVRIPRRSARRFPSLFSRGGELGNELAHAAPRVSGSFELGNVPTSGDDLDLRA